MLTLCLSATMFSVSGMSVYASADTEVVDTTFYGMSSAAAAYLSDTMANNGSMGGNIHSSAAGGLLGYCDEANTSGVIIDWLQSKVSSSSVSYSYDAIRSMGGAFINYANYGKSLAALGFDSTGTEAPSFSRMVFGGLMYGLYAISTAVNAIFDFIIKFLKFINPFRLITWGGTDLITITSRGSGIEAIDAGPVSLGDYISNLLDFIVNNFAWTIVIPGSVGLFIFYCFLTKRDKMYELRKLLWRIAIIAFCIPVVGSIYTTSLDWLGDRMNTDHGTPAVKVIASMFLDFESWAKNYNLSLSGTGVTINGLSEDDQEIVLDENITSLRNTTLNINRLSSGGLLNGITVGDSSDTDNWNDSLAPDQGSDATLNTSMYIRDLLNRYMSGAKYTPSDYYSDWKGPRTYSGDRKTTIDATNDLLDWTSGDAANYLEGDTAGIWNIGQDYGWAIGFSPMSIYNYLSTEFTDSNITVYSNEKATSGLVRQLHYSVNLVGSGLTAVMSYVNAVVMLGCLIVLASSYGLGIMIASVKRTFRSITSMPLAVLGSLRYGAKLIGNVMMMLVEVVVSLFMYSIAVSLLYGIMNMIDGLFSATLGTLGVLPATTLMLVEYIVSSILYVGLLIMLIRFRKKAVRGVDEMVADVINRLVPGAKSSDMIDTPKQSLGSKALGAAGAAAGIAATQIAGNAISNAVKGAQPGDGQAPGEQQQGDGNGGDGGDGGKEGDVNVDNNNSAQIEDNDQIGIEDKDNDSGAGGEGFDNDGDADNEGKSVMEADSLDDADTGNGMEEADGSIPDDMDGFEGDESGEAQEGDAQDGATDGDNAENGPGSENALNGNSQNQQGAGAGDNNTMSAGQQAVKKAQADLNKSEQQKKNLENALKTSGKDAMAQTGTAGKPMTSKEAQAGYAAAVKGPQVSGDTSQGKGGPTKSAPATVDTPAGKGPQAAAMKKADKLTVAEAEAATNAASAIANGAVSAGAKGAQAMTAAQQNAVGKAAVDAVKAANGGKMPPGMSETSVKNVAAQQAKSAMEAASPKATAQAAAMTGARAVLGDKPMSSNDTNLAMQAANEVRATASAATSPEGLAKAVAMDAARAANGGRALTSTQYQAVQNAAAQAATDVQNAALSSAEAMKGAPLTAAETSAIRQSCGVQAAQQAAVNAVEQCMETPLTDTQRANLMDAAKSHVGSIMADNTQTRVAERAADRAATAVRRANNLEKIPQKDYNNMMSSVRQQTQQTIAAAQPANVAASAAVSSLNTARRNAGRAPMNMQQTQQVVNQAANAPEIQQAFSGTYMAGSTEAMQAQTIREQTLSSNASEMARQMGDAQYKDNQRQTYEERASEMRSQTQANYREIEAMKSQLAARGYSKQQINAIVHGESRARRGETRGAQSNLNDNRNIGVSAGMAGTASYMSQSRADKERREHYKQQMDAAGAAKQPKPKPKRTLGESRGVDHI